MDSYFGFLAESGRVFSAPMETRQALPVIARKAVPRLGDLCAVHLLGRYGNVEVSFVAWGEPGSDSTQALQERFFAGPKSEADAAGLLAELGMESCLTYPLRGRGGGQLGYLTLGTLVPGGFAPDQEFLIEEFSRNVAFGLESQVQPDPGKPSETGVSLNEHAQAKPVEAEPDSTRELLRLVVEGAHDPILILDSTGRALHANDAALKCFGFASPEEAAHRPFMGILERWRIQDPEGRPLRPEALPFALTLAGQGPCTRLLRATHQETGEEHWWEMRAVPKPDRDGKAALVVMHIRDETRLRSLQASLKQERHAVRSTRNLMQSTMDALPDSLAVFDSHGRILYANKSMSDFLGPDTLDRGFTQSLKQLPDHLEFSEENGDSLAWDQLPLWAALRGEYVADRVVRYRDARKAKEGWTCLRAVPILDLRGHPVMVTALFQDLTGYKEAQTDREVIEARLRHTHKMDAVSRLAGGIAHDFNNLLTSIIGYADLIADSARSHPEIPGYAGEIRASANRAASLTAQLLAFGRRQMLHPKPVNINARLTSQLPLLQELAGNQVALAFRPAPDLPLVRVDPIKWDQAVLNLAINAGEAMPRGGDLVLATSFRKLEENLETEETVIPPGAYVVLEVADTGRGMDAETKARIFEPFFTTKDSVKASGLGLPMVLGFIRQSGGYLQLQSCPGEGAAFRIFLPALEEKAPGRTGPEVRPSGPGHHPGA